MCYYECQFSSLSPQSLLDNKGLESVKASAKAVEDAFNQGKYKEATNLWGECEDTVESVGELYTLIIYKYDPH